MAHWTLVGFTEIRELGRGATGRVVLARADDTGVPVAVKYLQPRLCGDESFLNRFREEARLLASVASPHVVTLYEYVEVDIAATSPGAAIIMEAVEGLSLRAILAQQPPLSPEAALVILKGSLLGLVAAHAVGVVHRDYKPDNVLVDTAGTSKLADFGIATRVGTVAGVEGTPPYMAPEQWRGQPATHATDIYAATATFFECLTGHVPYPAAGEDVMTLGRRHINDPIPVGQVPPGLRDLVRLGLAKDPDERYYDANAFLDRLEKSATAAYGSGWERRGRHYLVRVLALLSLLLPGAGTAPDSAATTTLGGPEPGGLDPSSSGGDPEPRQPGGGRAPRQHRGGASPRPPSGPGSRPPGGGNGRSRLRGALAGAAVGILALVAAVVAVALVGPRLARPAAHVADASANTDLFGVVVLPTAPEPSDSASSPIVTVPTPGMSAPTSAGSSTPPTSTPPTMPFAVKAVEIVKFARVPGAHQVTVSVKILTTNADPYRFRLRFEDITSADPPQPVTLTSAQVTGPTLIQTAVFTVPPSFRCAFQLRVTVRAPVPIPAHQDVAATNYRSPGETC